MEPLDYVVFEEDGVWVAHGLQHNIVTHGSTEEDAHENFQVLVEAYRKDGSLSKVPPAHIKYWKLFANPERIAWQPQEMESASGSCNDSGRQEGHSAELD